jgi:beta-glucosidase
LLTTILRKEWGYKGMVMTDWFGGNNAVEQMKAGNDLLMPGTAAQIKEITDALNDGKLSEAVLDENVARIIKTVLQSPTALNQTYSNTPDLKGHATIARNIAADGMILLKNNAAVLPLPKKLGVIATYGNTSYNFIAGGTGSGDVNEAYTVSLVQGLTDAGLKIDETLQKEYTAYIAEQQAKLPPKKFFFELPPPIEERKLSPEAIAEKAKTTAIALITIGRNAGEFQDRKKENDYYLSANELELIKNVSTAYHAAGKKVVVIINAGGVIDVTAWRDQVDGILLTWQGGQEAGHAVADLLTGKVNPSGKLAVTFPVDYNDISTANNFPGKNTSDKEVKGFGGMSMGFPSEVIYEEGIYVGYRFHNSFKVKTAFPFGFGLSYTNFAYSNLKFSSPNFNGSITVTVDVTNTGKVAGKEAVQLYLNAPSVKLAKPSEELKSFAKTGLLKPGQKQTVKFVLSPKDLASFDVASTSWIAEAGKYNVLIGASSTDFKLKGSFQLAKELVVEKCNKVIAPQIEIKHLGNQ